MGLTMLFIMIFCLYLSTIEVEYINGCDARGDGEMGTYLTRWILYKGKKHRLYFHRFTRSDYDDMHNHPWSFYSFIIWGGYIEQTPMYKHDGKVSRYRNNEFIKPLRLIWRPAEHIHRVVLPKEKPAYTLVFTRYKGKPWGFFTKNGFLHWRKYLHELGCN